MTEQQAGQIARRYCRLVDHMQGACSCPELTANILAVVAAERERARAALAKVPELAVLPEWRTFLECVIVLGGAV